MCITLLASGFVIGALPASLFYSDQMHKQKKPAAASTMPKDMLVPSCRTVTFAQVPERTCCAFCARNHVSFLLRARPEPQTCAVPALSATLVHTSSYLRVNRFSTQHRPGRVVGARAGACDGRRRQELVRFPGRRRRPHASRPHLPHPGVSLPCDIPASSFLLQLLSCAAVWCDAMAVHQMSSQAVQR